MVFGLSLMMAKRPRTTKPSIKKPAQLALFDFDGQPVVHTPVVKAPSTRPYRDLIVHLGPVPPKSKPRELTADEQELYADMDFVAYEEYEGESAWPHGRFWSERELGGGCEQQMTLQPFEAEALMLNPRHFGNLTCSHCNQHFTLDEFVWAETQQRLGT